MTKSGMGLNTDSPIETNQDSTKHSNFYCDLKQDSTKYSHYYCDLKQDSTKH